MCPKSAWSFQYFADSNTLRPARKSWINPPAANNHASAMTTNRTLTRNVPFAEADGDVARISIPPPESSLRNPSRSAANIMPTSSQSTRMSQENRDDGPAACVLAANAPHCFQTNPHS
jgi:hypothetical protein